MDDEKINKIFDLSQLFHPDHNIVKPEGATLNGNPIDFDKYPKKFDVNDPEYKEFMEEALETFNKINGEE